MGDNRGISIRKAGGRSLHSTRRTQATDKLIGPRGDGRARMPARIRARLAWLRTAIFVASGAVLNALGTLIITVASIESLVYMRVRLSDDSSPGSLADGGRLDSYILLVTQIIVPVVFGAAIILIGKRIGRNIPRAAIYATGLCAGFLSSLMLLLYVLVWFDGVLYRELAIYPVLGVAAGYAASLWELRYRNSKDLMEASLHRIQTAVTQSGQTRDLATQLGENLEAPHIGAVSIWTFDQGRATTGQGHTSLPSAGGSLSNLHLYSEWSEGSTGSAGAREVSGQCGLWGARRTIGAFEAPKLVKLGRGQHFTIHYADLPADARTRWAQRGLRGALVLPLALRGQAPFGLIMVVTQSIRQLRRWEVFGIWSQYQSIAEVSALVAEHHRVARRQAQQEERERIARDLHDSLSGTVSGIVLNLESVALSTHNNAREDGSVTLGRTELELLARARSSARSSGEELRRNIWALKPKHLEELSLGEAIAAVVDESLAGSGIETSVPVDGDAVELPAAVETSIYYVAKEAVNNVRDHSGATVLVVRLSYMGSEVILDVFDDGRGFDAADVASPGPVGKHGLNSMRSRVSEAGGEFELETTPGGPTVIIARFHVGT